MATSGSVNTNKVGNFYFTFSWSRTGYNSTNNTHAIYYEVVAHNTSSNYRTVYLKNLWIANTHVFYEEGTAANARNYSDGDVLTSGTINITSYNDAGDGSFTVSFASGVGIYPGSNCSINDTTWNLDRIPRYSTGTSLTVTAKTATSATLKWTANENCSEFQYKIGSGSWITVSGTGKTTTYTVTGLAPGTTYTFYSNFKRADSGLWSSANGNTPSTSVKTYSVGKVIAAPDFNDEANPTMTYTNEAGNTVTSLQACISLTGSADDIPYRDIAKTGTSYTFNLTETERNTLRNATSGISRNVIFYVKTVVGGNTYYSNLTKTLSIVNGNPTFSNYNYEDVGTTSTQYTGDSSIIVKDWNNIEITIPVADKAIAVKGATMSRYRAVCGDISDEQEYSSSSDVTLNLNNIISRTITVYAIDSRGLSTAVVKEIAVADWEDYFKPTITSATVTRTNGVQTDTTLTFSGTFWNDDFGVVQNEIATCSYKYKKTYESSYGSAITITPTILGNNFSFNTLIVGDEGANGFGISNSYNIELTIADSTGFGTTYDLLLGSGVPGMAIAPGGVSFGAPYDENIGGSMQLDGKKMSPNIMACNTNDTSGNSYNSGDYITFKTQRYNNSDGKIVFQNNGLITINHTGYIKVSFNIWINANSAARPWIRFKSYTNSTNYIDSINDISSGYTNYSASNCIIPVTSGEQFGLNVSTLSSYGFNIDGGSGSTSSYMTIELI